MKLLSMNAAVLLAVADFSDAFLPASVSSPTVAKTVASPVGTATILQGSSKGSVKGNVKATGDDGKVPNGRKGPNGKGGARKTTRKKKPSSSKKPTNRKKPSSSSSPPSKKPTIGNGKANGRGILNDLLFREADAIFDAIDANHDGEISNDELREHLEEKGYPSDSIRLLFTAVDKNADGVISREEMRFAFSNYEISALYNAFGLENKSGRSDKTVARKSDSDKDGGENNNKYKNTVSKIRSNAMEDRTEYSPEMLTKVADAIFDLIDVDGSGEIDMEELRDHFADEADASLAYTCFRQGDRTKTVASVENVLRALDLNSDGVISREEMRKGFREYDPRTLSSALALQID